MNFEDYRKDCVWINNYSRAAHVAEIENEQIVSGKREFRSIDNQEVLFCGALGIRCHEKICAPFHFIKKYNELQEQSRKDFLEKL